MTKFVIQGFRGTTPRTAPRLLKDNDAQVAINTRFETGELRGWNQSQVVATLAGSQPQKTLYLFGAETGTPTWLSFTNDVDIARSPVAADTTERTYYTGDGVPKTINTALVAANSYYELGVPAPTAAPVVSNRSLKSSGTVSGNMTCANGRLQITTTTGFTLSGHSNAVFELSTGGTANQLMYFTGFVVGLQMKVVSVIDADNFTVGSVTNADSICAGDPFTGWRVSPYATAPVQPLSGNIVLPNGMAINLTNHGLRVGDTLTVSAVATQPSVNLVRGRITPTVSGSLTQTPTDFVPMNSSSADVALSAFGNWSFTVVRTQAAVSVRSYVFTWVTDLGEESAPSAPTAEVDCLDGDTVSLSSFPTAPTTNRTIAYKYLYRTLTGTNATDYQFVNSTAVGVGTVTDALLDTALGEVLGTETWDPPPANMQGIISLPNGGMAGFFANVLCLSEPGFPHAWPVAYRQVTDFPIVGIINTGVSTFVMTSGMPYVIKGISPRSSAMERLDFHEACISKRSIATFGGAVFYASPSGLQRLTESGVTNFTGTLMTKEQWMALYVPTSMTAKIFQMEYWAAFSDGSANSGIMVVRPGQPDGTYVNHAMLADGGIWKMSQTFDGAYVHPLTGALYVTSNAWTVNYASQWAAGPVGTMTWRSKLFGAAWPVNMGACRVVSSVYPLVLKVYDGERNALIATKTIVNSEPSRLPAGHLSNQFYFELSAPTTAQISFVAVAETLAELAET